MINEDATRTKSKTISKDDPSKKVKLRISTESVFEIELGKITSKPNTMLGTMFNTDMAKPNQNGEYEIKNVNPMLFENIVNYYKKEKITKPDLRQKFNEAVDYLQIPMNKETFEDCFLAEMEKEELIIQDFNKLYDDIVKKLQQNSKKQWYFIFLISKERKDDCESCEEPDVDDELSFKFFVEEATHKHLMDFDDPLKRFLKSKGIKKIKKEHDVINLDFNTYIPETDYERYFLDMVVLEIFC